MLRRRLPAVLALVAFVGVLAAGSARADAPGSADTRAGAGHAVPCREVAVTVPARVALVGKVDLPVPSADWTIRATLCVPHGARTVELLLSGATYDREYWNFGYRPGRYSYVQYATAHGRATLNVDRLGVGASTHPLPELLTTATHAKTVHLLVQRLRSGAFGVAFQRVVLVGHSYGSVVALAEAGTYHDVDGLVLTAFTHQYGTGLATQFVPSLVPAGLAVPRFRGLPPGYLTTRSGTRAMFYYERNAEPAVIAHDAATRDTMSDVEAATFPVNLFVDGLRVSVPVLAVVGEYDFMLCGVTSRCGGPLSLVGAEQLFLPQAPSYRLVVVPDTGHALNLHRSAPRTFATIDRWLDRRE